ncbi:hypothetical protein FRB95_003962 [Tulasnella sp. JGI-2019a]|nr:hypothetical protein FRB95_003962 [Tulasnella sp. JGI-2019a]
MSTSSDSDEEPVVLPIELSNLQEHVESHPESFAYGDAKIQAAAIAAAKFLFDRAVQSEASVSTSIDDVLKSIEPDDRPTTRSTSAKRKRSPSPPVLKAKQPKFSLTPIDTLYLDGMGPDQIWEQLELRTRNICNTLESLIERDDESEADGEGEGPSSGVMGPGNGEEAVDVNGDVPFGFDEDDDDSEEDVSEEDSDEEESSTGSEEEDLGETSISLQDTGSDLEEASRPLRKGARHPVLDDDFFSIDDFNRQTEMLEAKRRGSGRLSKKDDEENSEDEDADDGIDYFAPLDGKPASGDGEDGMSSDSDAESDGSSDEDEDQSSDEGRVGPSEGIGAGMDLTGMNDIMYKDFFAPPPRFVGLGPSSQQHKGKGRAIEDDISRPAITSSGKGKSKSQKGGVRFAESVRVKSIKARGKGVSLRMMDAAMAAGDDYDGDEGDIGLSAPFMSMGPSGFGGFAPRKPIEMNGGEDDSKRTNGLADVDDEHDASEDEDEEETEDEDEDAMEVEMEMDDAGLESIERMKDDIFADEEEATHAQAPEMSTHEKRMAAIAREIATLEDENVAAKDWTLMGEANAKMRPENSLLATDLDFEHIAKAVPIITEEVTKSLEETIKQRILSNRFDDVIRQRPVDDKAFLPSSVFELQDSQSKKSLAQIYEDEYTAGTSGDKAITDDRDGKLAMEHEGIERAWNEICYKLDALSNAHFTPKQPKAVITTISNIASTSLESALPTSVSTSTLLAPQEVFAYDVRATKSKTELTPEEKKNIRDKIKKTGKRNRVIINSALTNVTMTNGSEKVGGSASAAAGFGKKQPPKTVREAKGMALDSLVKNGKGVMVVGKEHIGKARTGRNGAGSRDFKGAGGFKL